MTTLYEQFTAVKTSQKNWMYKPDVQQKLIDIFKIVCNIDLSSEEIPFKPDGGSFGMEIVYNYKFKYGIVYVQTDKQDMQVMFIFDNPYELTIPFSILERSHRCTVKVDHDLNFIESRFSFIVLCQIEHWIEIALAMLYFVLKMLMMALKHLTMFLTVISQKNI